MAASAYACLSSSYASEQVPSDAGLDGQMVLVAVAVSAGAHKWGFLPYGAQVFIIHGANGQQSSTTPKRND